MLDGLGERLACRRVAQIGQGLRRSKADERMRTLEAEFQNRLPVLAERFESQGCGYGVAGVEKFLLKVLAVGTARRRGFEQRNQPNDAQITPEIVLVLGRNLEHE